MKPKNRVLMLVENDGFPSDSRVVSEARTLVSAGYKVSVVCPRFTGQKLYEVSDGIIVYRYPSFGEPKGRLGYLWEYTYSLVAMLLISCLVFFREGFDVIHVQNPPDFLFIIGLVFKLFGKMFIFDQNDPTPELYLSRFGHGKLALSLFLFLEKVSCKVATIVITAHGALAELAISRDGISPEKIVLVRNSPNLEHIRSLPLNESRDNDTTKIRLGYVGYLDPQDGGDKLLKSLYHLAYSLEKQNFHCIIIGDGKELDGLKLLAQEMAIDRHVTFTGKLPWKDAMEKLSDVNICLEPNPSSPLNDIITTVKVLEYMALQKPVVAYDLPEQRSVIEGAAVFVQNNDELEFARGISQLMDNAKLRKSLGTRGREKMEEELNWERSAANLIQAYEWLNDSKPVHL